MILDNLPKTTHPSEHDGWYINAWYPGYLFTPYGEVFSLNRGKFLTSHQTHRGYLSVVMTDYELNVTDQKLHRLMATVFIQIPDGYSYPGQLEVNHIDGNKKNNKVDNLEWCTREENMLHASREGLHPRKLPVSIYNLKTNEVHHFDQRIDAARYLGISKDAIQTRLNAGEGVITPEGYLVRYTDRNNPDKPWKIPADYEKTFWENRNGRPWVVRNLITGEIVLTGLQGEVANFLNIVEGALSTWVQKVEQPVFHRDGNWYQIKPDINEVKWVPVPDIYEYVSEGLLNQPIYVWDTLSGNSVIYLSAREAAKDNYLLPTTLNERLKLKRNKPWKDGKIYLRYLDAKELGLITNIFSSIDA